MQISRRALLAVGAGALLVPEVAVARRAPAAGAPGRKRALIIAIDKYARENDPHSARDLHCQRDAMLLQKVLEFHGFAVTARRKPEETQGQGIKDALAGFLADTQPNDVLFVHYSGHGSQVEDPGDPLGFDQTLVPSDYKSTNDGANDVPDKVLAGILRAGLSKVRPAAFLLTFDSCHSGTITRDSGVGERRGFERAIAKGLRRALDMKPGLYASEAIAQQGFTAISACRSAESAVEIDDDGEQMGALSYALVKALGAATELTTYRDLFENVTCIMRAKGTSQTPQMEGTPDQKLFSAGTIQPRSYIKIERVDDKAVLKAGKLMGIEAGTKLAVFAPDADLKTGKSVEGVVKNPGLTVSEIEAPGMTVTELNGCRAVVTALAYHETPLKVSVARIRQHHGYAAIAKTLDDMKSRGLVVTTEADKGWDIQICPAAEACKGGLQGAQRGAGERWDVEVAPVPGSGVAEPRKMTLVGADPSLKESVILLRGDSSLLACQVRRVTPDGNKKVSLTSLAGDDTLPRNIEIALTRETRHRLMSGLVEKPGDADIHIEMRLFECNTQPDLDHPGKVVYVSDKGKGPLASSRDAMPTLKLGSHFRIEMRNTGTVKAHVALVDLNPQGGIGPMWPNPEAASIDNDSNVILPAEQGKEAPWIPLTMGKGEPYKLWTVSEPVGVETLVAIATREFADFGPLFDLPAVDRGMSSKRGPGPEINSPLGKLFANYTKRDADSDSEVPNNWTASACHVAFAAPERPAQ